MERANNSSRDILSKIRHVGLRLLYGVIALFLLATVAPLLADRPPTMMTGVARVLLVALGCMAALGVLRPHQMLPIMMFEFLWKFLWLVCIGLPLWTAGSLDAANAETFTNVAVGIPLVLLVFPYRYAWDHYVKKPTDARS
jgi:hypothetical protein